MSSEDTKPKVDDTETEEDKSSQDEAEPEKVKVKNADDKKDDVKPVGNDSKDDASGGEEGADGGDTDEEDLKKPAKKRTVKHDDAIDEERDTEEDEDDDEDEKKNGVPEKETRDRKKPERLGDDEKKEKKEVEIEIPKGKGIPFGECPRIDHFIKTKELDQLKKLHLVCYGRVGKPDLIKANLLQFKGFDYEPESDAFTKKKQSIGKLDFKHLKDICEVLDVEKKGKKEDLITRLMEFLMDPKDSGKAVPAVPAPRPKRTSAVKANNRGYAGLDAEDSDEEDGGKRGRGRRAKARPSYKDDSSSEEDRKVSKRGPARKYTESDAESEPELSPSESDSDSQKKKKATPVKPKGRGAPKRKATPAAKTAKKPATKRGKKKSSDSEPPSESEDEPLQKKAKKFPSDEEIKKYVKQILDGANLEEITMKTVCKEVYGRYPEHDLTHKKDLIKTTVKSLIAT